MRDDCHDFLATIRKGDDGSGAKTIKKSKAPAMTPMMTLQSVME
jgi:hypothetical protein